MTPQSRPSPYEKKRRRNLFWPSKQRCTWRVFFFFFRKVKGGFVVSSLMHFSSRGSLCARHQAQGQESSEFFRIRSELPAFSRRHWKWVQKQNNEKHEGRWRIWGPSAAPGGLSSADADGAGGVGAGALHQPSLRLFWWRSSPSCSRGDVCTATWSAFPRGKSRPNSRPSNADESLEIISGDRMSEFV